MSIIEYVNKARKYCAYQERCESDLQTKLKKLGLPAEKVDQIVELMIKEGFIDDRRFAESFVRSKLRANAWGQRKIRQALLAKRIRSAYIDDALETVDQGRYNEKLLALAKKKFSSLHGDLSDYEKRQKTAVYLQGKGFETDLIFNTVNNLHSDE